MVTLESFLFLLVGLYAGRFFSDGFIGGYFKIIDIQFLKWTITPIGFFLDILSIVAFLGSLWLARRPWSWSAKFRYYLTFGCIAVSMVMIFQIVSRGAFGSRFGAHDGVVQTEVAANFLLHGKNPYTESYVGTPFGKYNLVADGTISPILSYYPYPPLVPLVTLPAVWLSHIGHFTVDGRMVTMIAYIMFCVMLLLYFRDPRLRVWLVLALLYNPLAYGYWMIGMNDILFVLFLVATALFVQRQAWVWSGVCLALAVASKQTAFLALPLWAWLVWLHVHQGNITKKVFWRSMISAGGILAIFYGPFLIWNAGGMYDDLIRYVSGTIPKTYPIAGDSLWQVLVIFRWVPDSWVATQHSIAVIVVAIVTLSVSGFWLRHRPTASQWLTAISMMILVMGLANRFFYENYLAAALLLLIPAVALDTQKTPPTIPSITTSAA